jgi:hypothetical protein
MTATEIPELDPYYVAKIGALKLAWWMLLGGLSWVAVWKIATALM